MVLGVYDFDRGIRNTRVRSQVCVCFVCVCVCGGGGVSGGGGGGGGGTLDFVCYIGLAQASSVYPKTLYGISGIPKNIR